MKLNYRFTRPSKGDIAFRFLQNEHPLMFDSNWDGYSIRPSSYINSFLTMRRPTLFLSVTMLPMMLSTIFIIVCTTHHWMNPSLSCALYMLASCLPGTICAIASYFSHRKNTWHIPHTTLELIPSAEDLVHSYCASSYKYIKSENELAFQLIEYELFASSDAYDRVVTTVANQTKGKFTWTIPA